MERSGNVKWENIQEWGEVLKQERGRNAPPPQYKQPTSQFYHCLSWHSCIFWLASNLLSFPVRKRVTFLCHWGTWGTQGWNNLLSQPDPKRTSSGGGPVRGNFGSSLVYTGSFKLRIWIFPHSKYRNDPGFAWFLKDPGYKNEAPTLSILAIDITSFDDFTIQQSSQTLTAQESNAWLFTSASPLWPRGKDL